MPVGLVATDLDGTIVGHDGTVSARTVAALAAVEDAGVPLVLVTGRPPRWMRPVVEATGHRGVAICANGGVVYDLHTERILEAFLLPLDAGLEAVRRIREVMPRAVFAVETGAGFSHEPAYRTRWDSHLAAVRIAPAEELVAVPVVKLLVRDEDSDGDAMLELARQALGGLVEVTHSNPNDCLLEISALGVSKATTLARVAAEHGVEAADVLAFGDQPNDLPMLAWAGTAYAVANAHPEVLAAVPLHTASVDEDGVAQVLENLLADGGLRR
ncbi:MAG TPA: HAD family hydrolase [Actinomycetes bacterium]